MRDNNPRARGLFNTVKEWKEFREEGLVYEDTGERIEDPVFDVYENFPRHMPGWNHGKNRYESRKPPARQALGRIFEPLSAFHMREFRSSLPASLEFADVKEVGTYMVPKGTSEVVKPAEVPEYLMVQTRTFLERSLGAKRPPQDDDAYKEYADKRCTLVDAATKVVPESLSHDFVADRGALLALLGWVNYTLTQVLYKEKQNKKPIDIAKISKTDGGGALVLDCLFNKMNLYAEQPKQRGKYNPAERPRGGFKEALARSVTGDVERNFHIKGFAQQVREHDLPECYKFLEIPLDGLKLTVRAPKSHVHKGRRSLSDEVEAGYAEKAVELKYANNYHPASVSLLDTYFRMLLGKVDMYSFSLQSNGYFKTNQEFVIEDLTAKNPKMKGVAEQHMGRLTNLLKQVSEKIASDGGDGPWVLQWKNGTLLLGKYELTPLLEVQPEDLEEEILMA
jgi:hypothetical protein